jgi:hypothetical protein
MQPQYQHPDNQQSERSERQGVRNSCISLGVSLRADSAPPGS